MFDDEHRSKAPAAEGADPDAPPSEEELEKAAALRDALAGYGEPAAGPEGAGQRAPEAAWLAAHLRLPTEDDALGDLPARSLARAARETAAARQAVMVAKRARRSALRRMGRGLWGAGGLLAAAALLLLVSSVLLDQAGRPGPGGAAGLPSGALSAALLRASFRQKESPSQRLDLMIEERLQAVRAGAYRGAAPGRGRGALAAGPGGAMMAAAAVGGVR